MNDRLRVAIVGAGLMGRWHATYARKMGARVAAVVDPVLERASALGKRFRKALVCSDLEQALVGTSFTAVHVCTPLPGHASIVATALRFGKDVLCEKPLAASTAECRALFSLSRDCGRQLTAVHQFPFQRCFHDLVRDFDRLGEPVRVSLNVCSAGGEGHAEAPRRAILLELLPHVVSVFRALPGPMRPLSWRVERFTAEDLNLLAVEGSTSFGASLSLRGRPPCNELTVVGSRATAVVDLFHGFCLWCTSGRGRIDKVARPFRHGLGLLWTAGSNLLGRALRREPAYPGLCELLAAWYESLRRREPAPVGEAEIIEAALLREQVEQSMMKVVA